MDTKLSSDFWSEPAIEDATLETKLAALWLLTNERVTLCGYAEVTEKRFAFETGLAAEALARAIEALPKTFRKIGKGYWAPNFIRRQFGHGPALARSNMSMPVVNALRACPEEVVNEVLGVYPELLERYEHATERALAEGLPSPTQGQRARTGAGEGARTGASSRAGEGEPAQAKQKKAKAGSLLPADQPVGVRVRMLALNPLLRRSESTRWAAEELAALIDAGLVQVSEADFTEQLGVMMIYYRASIPREKSFRRTSMLTLLRHWAGELDRARAWARENDDGVKRMN